MTHLNVQVWGRDIIIIGQRAAGKRERRQEKNIRQSTWVHKYERDVSEHFTLSLKRMLPLNHCSETDWIYT